ncbi:unnamed protein product [Penicillium olsonii]|uniref:Zn(2)-C6 fungal-type domain-containing protein n=1 Tax=Penicillium olsonii TaxID=99116 RepID=A0A9W4HTN5_PENOL|nr:unnamed protein product [Penicillium olsonii]CAG8160020.1 unnamed protein product [Penicillium olsonii]
MPSRRSHTKSRKGCLECKRRHVKCDEGIPKCSLCRKRKLECSYPPPNEDADSPQGSSINQDEVEGSATGELPQATRMMEARLFHQYMTSTYHTLAQDGLSANHLSVNIPRLATSFVYLLDGIHALSALHLASIETDNRVSWLDAALRYQSQACSGLGKVLADITTREYEPAFVTSIFIMLFAMGYRVISVDTKPPDPLSLVREIRTLISGPAMLFDKIVKGGFTAKLEHWMHVPDTKESLPDVTNTNTDTSADTNILFRLHANIITSLDRLHTTINTNKGPHHSAYQVTWQQLYQAIEPWPKIGPQGGPLAWPLFLSDEFFTLIQNGDWIARVLFLHYGTAMRLLCHRWYVRDWGRRLVLATLESLEDIPPEWVDTISWIRRAAERED